MEKKDEVHVEEKTTKNTCTTQEKKVTTEISN